jgi:phosphoribosylanthranilate isomerase
VAIETAATLAERARARGLKTVAVTVDMDDAGLDEIVASMKPDWLQLHGGETPERAADSSPLRAAGNEGLRHPRRRGS